METKTSPARHSKEWISSDGKTLSREYVLWMTCRKAQLVAMSSGVKALANPTPSGEMSITPLEEGKLLVIHGVNDSDKYVFTIEEIEEEINQIKIEKDQGEGA